MSRRVVLSKLDLNLLMVLDELLRERSVTRAAANLYLSQPAVSSSLHRLRLFYEDELLIRVGRQFELTPLAEELAPKVAAAVESVNAALDCRQSFDPMTSQRTFTIAMSSYIHCIIFKPLLDDLQKIAPEVHVKLIPSRRRVYEYSVSECDLIIGIPPLTDDYCLEPLIEDDWCAVADRAFGEDDHAVLSEREWSSLNWMRAPSKCMEGYVAGANGAVIRSFDGSSPNALNETLYSGNSISAALSVRHTDFVAFVPRRLAAYLVELGGFRILDPPMPTPTIIEYVWWRRTRQDDAGLTWIREELRKVVETL